MVQSMVAEKRKLRANALNKKKNQYRSSNAGASARQ
jgi:hypothetical protein